MTPDQLLQQLKLLTSANRHAFLRNTAERKLQEKLSMPKPPAS